MLSQFFILSSRGDTLAFRDYRGDVVRGTPEIFYRRVKGMRSASPTPIFHIEGTQFLHILYSGLYFVCTTKENVAPVFVLELLNKIGSICKDYCGNVTEEAVRVNFPLIYEILDEILDFGYPQCTSTDILKEYVFNSAHVVNNPVSTAPPSAAVVFGVEKRSIPSTAPNKSVIESSSNNTKNEVYIDMVETMTVILAANGQTIRSEIDGAIKVRSFLAGKPEIRMALNGNIRVNNSVVKELSFYGHSADPLVLDNCCFHDCVDIDEFEQKRELVFAPQAGECSVMTYRKLTDFPLPFRIHSFLEVLSESEISLRITLKCEVPTMFHAVSIGVKIAAPKTTTSVDSEASTGNNTVEYQVKEKLVTWSIKKMTGGSEHNAVLKFKVPLVTNMCKKQIGPISLSFEFPMYVSSKMQIKSLKVIERNNMYTPLRWIRYITHSNSYVIRL